LSNSEALTTNAVHKNDRCGDNFFEDVELTFTQSNIKKNCVVEGIFVDQQRSRKRAKKRWN